MGPIVNRLPAHLGQRLRLPLIAAPMLGVSGPELVIAACRAGVMGAFPTINASLNKGDPGLDAWLEQIMGAVTRSDAPVCANLVMRTHDLQAHVQSLIRHKVEMVITSVGSPAPILPQLHEAGIFVLADVASLRHAEKAIEAGVDGLVLLTAGAGGHTGWLNPFAYVRAVRRMFDGPIVLAGGMVDGVALRAAQVLGCDLAYMGTRFIATRQSMASAAYRELLVDASMDDIVLTRTFSGLPANYLRQSLQASGIGPEDLDETMTVEESGQRYGSHGSGPRRWVDILSAGHSVSGVQATQDVADLVRELEEEYRRAGV
ncbi:MAG: nitronate monooxygenase [Ottowia sp.]|nr:nitronate monooxygenase [Ottowia sp.]